MPTMSTRPQEEVKEGEACCFPCWKTLPDDILLHIFSSLEAESLYHVGLVCKPWLRVAFDEFLWKDLFYHHWKISRSIPMASGKYSWVQEYKRLLCHTPAVESETLKHHVDQVLHVSYSHNGTMFATCSKDGFIRVWDTTYPTSLKHKTDMHKITWKYTQFSQFNESDTLLLVSGVHFGSLSTSGDIAVFSLTDGNIHPYNNQNADNCSRLKTPRGEFIMQSRVLNKPYDVFGTWYNDLYLLSGNLHWTGHLNSCSVLWLNKAYQETTSEEESVVMRLFKFSNVNASSIRTIMISNCLTSDESEACAGNAENASSATIGQEVANEKEINSNLKRSQNMEADGVKMKQQKPQGVRSNENGCFCTKLKTVDNDDGSDRLNGTIEYSRDYRLAETLSDSRVVGSENEQVAKAYDNAAIEDIWQSVNDTEDTGCDASVAVNANIAIHEPGSSETVLLGTDIPGSSMDFMGENQHGQTSCRDMDVTYNCHLSEADPEAVSVHTECEVDLSGCLIEIQMSDSVSKKRQLHDTPEPENSPVIDIDDLNEIAIQEYLCSIDSPSLKFCCVDNKKQKLSTSKRFQNDIYSKYCETLPANNNSSSSTSHNRQGSLNPNAFDSNVTMTSDNQVPCSSTGTPNSMEISSSFADNSEIKPHTDFTLPLYKETRQSVKHAENPDKYLIFTKGSKTYTPHQIGIKRIKPLKAFSSDGRRLLPNVSENLQGLDRPEDEYDTVDHLIDMHGHIIGMSLAPDHRYLYVNSRPWPQNYQIQDPLCPPPIAQEIDIHVIDLMNMREVGTMHRSHKAYTSNDECFFIFLDVCDEYVASGAEDKHGYLWDRHYGLCLHKYPHTDVVNSVAFNPVDPEVLVTVSDDFSIKVWRSRARQREVTSKYEECVGQIPVTDTGG